MLSLDGLLGVKVSPPFFKEGELLSQKLPRVTA